MTTLLEQRYRSVLRLLPSYYREAREEEMVETYLHGIGEGDQDEMRPDLGEVASVLALAVRTRLGAVGAPPGYAALGESVRLFALFGVLLQATDVLTEAVLNLTWAGGSAADRSMFFRTFTGHGLFGGTLAAVMWLLPLLWTAAYAALFRDHRRAARLCAVLAALPAAFHLGTDLLTQPGPATAALAMPTAVFAWLTALAVCCGFHADSRPARLPAVPPGLTFMTVCVLMGASVVLWPAGADSEWAAGTAFTVAAVGWLVLRHRSAVHAADFATPLALAALGLVVLTLRLGVLSLLNDAQAPGACSSARRGRPWPLLWWSWRSRPPAPAG